MKVLLATNGSADSEAACDLLAQFRWSPGDSLHVITVIPSYLIATPQSGRIDGPASAASPCSDDLFEAQGLVQQTVRRLMPFFPRFETRIHAGAVGEEILGAAQEIAADLIVLGGRLQSTVEEWVRDGVGRFVLKRAECPVLIARPGSGRLSRVLLAYDGSRESQATLQWATRIPLPADTQVEVVSVAEPIPALEAESGGFLYAESLADEKQHAGCLADRAVEPLRSRGISARAHLRCGAASAEIAALARELAVDLILIGAHAKRGWIKDLLGNTALEVVHHSACSIAVIRSSGVASHDLLESYAKEEPSEEGTDEDNPLTEPSLSYHEGTDESMPLFSCQTEANGAFR